MAVRRRHPATAYSRESHVASRINFATPSSKLYGSQLDIEPIPGTDIGAGSVTTGSIAAGGLDAGTAISAGTLPASTFDTTAPPAPTDLALSADYVDSSDGTTIIRLTATVSHPADTDYFGTYIEITRDHVDGTPFWTDSVIYLLLGKDSVKVSTEGVAGNTQYWARGFAVDVQGNKSTVSNLATTTTPKDTVAPSIPTSLSATGGFRGVAMSWSTSGEPDLMLFEVRWGTDDATWPNKATTLNTVYWVPDLIPDTLYYFQVRAVDFSGNVYDGTPVGVDYQANPDTGWTASVSATPSQVGSADIAAESITSAMISTSGLSADIIRAGTLTLKPTGGVTALEVRDSGGALVGSWDPTLGIKIFGTPSSDYAHFDDAYLRFYKTGVLTAEIGPDGIVADSIKLGTLSGGHNVVLNSSFEGSAFTTGQTSVTFTDGTGTPGWKAANRTTAPINLTDGVGTTLTPDTVSF